MFAELADTFAGRPSKEAAATPSEQRESRGGQQAEGAAGQEAPDGKARAKHKGIFDKVKDALGLDEE